MIDDPGHHIGGGLPVSGQSFRTVPVVVHHVARVYIIVRKLYDVTDHVTDDVIAGEVVTAVQEVDQVSGCKGETLVHRIVDTIVFL